MATTSSSLPASFPQRFEVPFLGEVGYSHTYPNGHRLIYVQKPGEVFNVSTWVRTGSIHENEENSGVSHFLEHLMFKGTKRFAPGEFDRAMESMGAIINAATWKDFTFYYITGPNRNQGEFNKALDLHADMLVCSTLPEGEIGPPYDPFDKTYTGLKRERAVVIEEIGMREDQPWTKVYNAVNNMMYPEGHPYRRDVIGTRQIIGEIPRERIVAYYRRWYSAPEMTTLVVGEFDFEWLKTEVEKAFCFDSIPDLQASPFAEPEPNLAAIPKNTPASVTYMEQTGDYTTRFFMLGYHGPAIDNHREQVALDVASYVLGESRSSRLIQTLIEQAEEPNFNTVGCGQSTFKLGNVFYVQGNFLSEDVSASLGQVRAEVERFLYGEPMTEDEFKRAVKKLKVQFAETAETASGLADSLGEALTITGGLSAFTEYLNVLNSLTKDEVLAVARQYLDPKKAVTAVLLPNQPQG